MIVVTTILHTVHVAGAYRFGRIILRTVLSIVLTVVDIVKSSIYFDSTTQHSTAKQCVYFNSIGVFAFTFTFTTDSQLMRFGSDNKKVAGG